MALRGIAIALLIAAASLIALSLAADVAVDWLWSSSIGYLRVFLTILGAKAAVFLCVFVASAALLGINGIIACRLSQGRLGQVVSPWSAAHARLSALIPWRSLILGGTAVLAAFVALGEMANWELVLRFIYQVPYGQSDPLYQKDIGFYLFSLPAYVALKNWALLMVVFSAFAAGAIYFVRGSLAFDPTVAVAPPVIAHGSALLGLYFLLKALSYWLDRYLLLYGDNGVVVGASYTDAQVQLPVLLALARLALAASFVSWVNMWVRSYKLPVAGAVIVFGGSLILSAVFPAIFQRVYVKPNELQLETPYLRNNITLTREAYNLRQIEVKPFPAEQGLTYQSLQENRATIDNIRLWDWQPLIDTYAQLQEIRTYYRFLDVDVDRYDLGGGYQQVMLSPRELDPSRLPTNAQTWVNLHLVYTHGDGVVMSPVTQKSAEGLPILYLGDIPPVATGGPSLSEPRIYFGLGASTYAIVNGSIQEFDYPEGKDNVYTNYHGADGIGLGGVVRRSLFAWYFDDLNILITNYITDESRILMRRDIRDRVHTIAPFLRLDHDPYAVISGGRLYWIQDAYTTSDWFPYSQQIPRGGTNYIRNSVKVVIDAYNGSADFYVTQPVEPIIAVYQRIFPRLFKPLPAMPEDLQKHIRYPEDLFLIQAHLFRAYHMESPEVFYNREDLWQFPRRPTGADGMEMEPYYINMRLPGEARAEFFLMLPMAPSQRENMIAWLAARCDAPDYGKLIVYEFPKDKLVYGPFQIEARINQNTEISQLISLWNQMGSRIIRGNLLVVPIENSILYVTPLYLRAETGQLPELKRVIAAYGDRVVMEETLAGALAALFKEPAPPSVSPPGPLTAPGPAGAAADRAREALSHYDRAMERLKAGDWSGFGEELHALRALLEQLNSPSGGRQ